MLGKTFKSQLLSLQHELNNLMMMAGKSQCILKYLNGIKHLCLTFCVNKIFIIKWYVDASYANHDNCQGQTGEMMTFREGTVTSFSQKQKIIAKYSTKAELIGVDEALPQILRKY